MIQNVVTSSRSLGAVYRNQSKTPMTVSVSCVMGPGGYMGANVDSSPTPSTRVAYAGVTSNGTENALSMTFVAEPLFYYQVEALDVTDVVTMVLWTEWN